MKPVRKIMLIDRSVCIGDAFKQLNESGTGILLVVDDQRRLIRTLTDGDLRRLVSSGLLLGDSLSLLPEKQSITAKLGESEVILLTRMNSFGISQIPIVDDNMIPLRMVYRQDIDKRIYLSSPHLSGLEHEFVDEAFDTNWIAPLGPNVDAFELEIAEQVGAKRAVALSSGTAAIHLALSVLDVGAGDVVFCSTLTFVASANPIAYQGATAVFIDSEPESWNMSPVALERALVDASTNNKLPKAVVVVNLYGQSADYDPICELCDRYGVPVVEDAAQSLGASYKGKHSGTSGRVGIYSFNGNKIITTSGGGMLVTDVEDLADKARFLSTQAKEPVPYYHHKQIGFNYRMSNILAGIGRGQLKVLEQRVLTRREIFNRYSEMLSDVPIIQWMPEASFGRTNRWLSTATIDLKKTEISIDRLVDEFARNNIEARHLWKPMHRQPIHKGLKYFPHRENRSISDELFATGICLPSGSNLTEEQQGKVVEVLRFALGYR